MRVCDTLALEKDEEEQKILLKRIEILFNNYFMSLEYRETYDLKIFFGMDEAKYDLLNYYKEHIRYQQFKALLYKSEWTWAETEEVKKILNGY